MATVDVIVGAQHYCASAIVHANLRGYMDKKELRCLTLYQYDFNQIFLAFFTLEKTLYSSIV